MKQIILIYFLFISFTSFAHQLPPGFASLQIADGLDPVDMAITPDDRLFITEKFGRVLIVENGLLQPDPFIEIPVDNFNERGLSGIAIDPDFASNGFVYLYYTVPEKDHNRISRFTADGNFAQPNSEFILMDLDSLSGPHHNAGAMDFGADGKLYVAVGDGFSTEVAQDMSTTLGKILRLNPDGSIPTDNPFIDQTAGNAKAIWALGFRNPFAMTVHPQSGRFFATDVGSFKAEEVNEIWSGKNYGWPMIEGIRVDQIPPPEYVDPLLAYGHAIACAATGIEFYAPQQVLFPAEYVNQLFYSDYCSGNINVLNPDTGETFEFATEIDRPLNLLTAHDGTLYFIARGGLDGGSATANTASSNGQLWRVFYTGNNAPFISVQPKDILVPLGENAVFETVVSGASPLSFQWQKGGVDIIGETASALMLQNPSLSENGTLFRCIVANPEGADTTQNAELQVTTNQRPDIEILSPPEGKTYRAGDEIVFSGVANDPEEGNLPADNFRWKIDFHHNEHTHPALGPLNGISDGILQIPKAGEVSENVWFRINFTATDGEGLDRTTQRLVFPEKTQFSVKSSPPGLPIETNGNLSETPYIVPSVIGVIHQLKAPQTAIGSDSLYTFERWSTGKTERQIVYDAPEDESSLTAIYRGETALSDGQGLQAFYFDDPLENSEFSVPFAFSQIDPQINFSWDFGSPNEAELGNDFYLIRWEGYVQPLVEGDINFHVISDDGVRLWVGEELLIDKWIGQSLTEHTGTLFMEAEKYYPIKLEYFESIGEAAVRLLWSGDNLERTFVPAEQLFPIKPKVFEGEELEAEISPNPISGLLKVQIGSPVDQAIQMQIFNSGGQRVYTEKHTLPEGYSTIEINLADQSNGVYFLLVETDTSSSTLEFVKL